MRKIIIILFFVLCVCESAFCAEKQWSGAGDATYWKDPDNWSPTGVPSASDDVSISLEDADVYVDETFYAKTLTIGGRGAITLTVLDFVYGYITPASASDTALDVRKDGLVVFKGAG